MQSLLKLLADYWKWFLAAAAIAVLGWAFLDRQPPTATPSHAIELHGEAQANAQSSNEHAQQAGEHEAQAAAHGNREAELEKRVDQLKRELDAERRKPHPTVGGGVLPPGGDPGTDPVAGSPVELKLQQLVDEQGALIVELKADNQSLHLALDEQKMATRLMNTAYTKEAHANAELQAHIKRINSEVRAEVVKAEIRGGLEGALFYAALKAVL